jgi:hypothetical protein
MLGFLAFMFACATGIIVSMVRRQRKFASMNPAV